jgi:hypothetical protein
MSMHMVTHVRSISKSTRSARHLLLVIASHVNPETGWAWPSLDTLAEETTLTRRRVIQLIHGLEALGELEVRRGRGRGHVNFYRVHLAPVETGPSARAEKVKCPARKGEIFDDETVKSLSPKRKSEREKKGAPPAPFLLSPEKPEMQNPFWCDAHGFCHGERLPDRHPDCAREVTA